MRGPSVGTTAKLADVWQLQTEEVPKRGVRFARLKKAPEETRAAEDLVV